MSDFRLSSRSLVNMDGVHDDLVRVALRALEITLVDFGIPSTGGRRTVATQARLFVQGASKCDGVHKLSKHQDGDALDFFAYVGGAASWDPHHLAMVAAAFLQAASELGVRIRWGGLFRTFSDMPHVELLDG